MIQTFKDGLVLASLFSQILFFCICGLAGVYFEGSDSSPLLKLTVMSLGVLTIIVVLREALLGRIHLGVTFWLFALFVPAAIFVDSLIEKSFPLANISYISHDLLFWAAFGLTAIFSAFYMAQRGLCHFAKWIEVIMLVITAAAFKSAFGIIGGAASGIGGASYQKMSYYVAFAFCLNLCFILFGERMGRFAVFQTRIYTVCSYVLLVMQLLSCLLSGGRGGFVLLLAASVYMLFVSHKVTKLILLAALALCFGYTFFTVLPDSSFAKKLNKGTERVFSYIDKGGINMHKTSHRDIVYGWAIKQIEEDNYTGRGLFRADADLGNYPHNLVLELLMQGGVAYLLLWLVIIVSVLFIVHRQLLLYDEHLIIPMVAYPFIMLMFSGTYLYTQFFWFCITYVFMRKEVVDC